MNPNETISQTVNIIMESLKKSDAQQMPLRILKSKLHENLGEATNAEVVVNQAIEYALDKLIVSIQLDYDDGDEEFLGELVWFLCFLTEEDSKYLRSFSEMERVFLRILRNSETDGRLGVIRADIALKKLQELGFDLDYVPYIPNVTNDFFLTENGELVEYHYIIPEYEKSEEHNAELRDFDEKERRKQDYLEELDN